MRDLVAARVAGVSSMVHRGQGCPAASALMIAPQYGQQTLRLEPVAGGATVAGAESLGGKSVARLISSSPPSINASDIPDSTFRRSLQRRLQAERTANPALRAICRLKTLLQEDRQYKTMALRQNPVAQFLRDFLPQFT